MLVDLDRNDLLNLIVSLLPPYGGDEFSTDTGNQWNDNWCYKRKSFDKMTDDELLAFYQIRKENDE